MNPCVAQSVFALTFVIVYRFGWKSMADKLGVQIARMVRRFEREAEIIHREYVFKKFRFLEIANTAGLAGIVECVRERIRSHIEGVVIS